MRISRQHMFMQMAEVAAMRSTCFRGNVGAIVVHDRDIVSMGYNGPPSGESHCQGNDCEISTTGGCQRSDHAEANAIDRAKKKLERQGHYLLMDCEMYCTYSPCPDCAARLVRARVKRFFYRYSYRLKEGLDLLNTAGIAVYRVTPSGFVILDSTKYIVTGELPL